MGRTPAIVGPTGEARRIAASAEACRARLPEVEVVVASAEALPFAAGTFDLAASQLVVNFMADAEAGSRASPGDGEDPPKEGSQAHGLPA